MARTKTTKLPGSIFLRGERYYWNVRLPSEDKHKTRPLRWSNEPATTDKAEAERIATWLYQQALAESIGVAAAESPTKPTQTAQPMKRQTAQQTKANGLTVAQLVERYKNFADKEYVGSKEPTSIKYALAPLANLYADLDATEVRPLQLLNVRQSMVDEGLSRKTVNDRIAIIRRMYAWASELELIESESYYRLMAVKPLRFGRGGAKESKKVKPISADVVEATAEFASPVVADMMRLQMLTGMRSGELVIMRPCDVDTTCSDGVWRYRPTKHKTQRFGHIRIVPLGAESQAILAKYLDRKPSAFCFSPKESYAMVQERRSAERTTPMSCGNVRGSHVAAEPKTKRGNRYTSDTYYQAIERAIERANFHRKASEQLPQWHPHRLRHTASTRIRKEHGLDTARVIIGHKTLQMADHYGELEQEAAFAVAR